MLNKYWNSPALALTIRPSVYLRVIAVVLGVAAGFSNYLILIGENALFAIALVPLSAVSILAMIREPLVGCSFGWREGQWYVFSQGSLKAVELVGRPICLSICARVTLQSRSTGERYNFSLFPDSSDPKDLRRLRSRLLLER